MDLSGALVLRRRRRKRQEESKRQLLMRLAGAIAIIYCISIDRARAYVLRSSLPAVEASPWRYVLDARHEKTFMCLMGVTLALWDELLALVSVHVVGAAVVFVHAVLFFSCLCGWGVFFFFFFFLVYAAVRGTC